MDTAKMAVEELHEQEEDKTLKKTCASITTETQASSLHFDSEMRTRFDCCNHLGFWRLSFHTAAKLLL